MAFEILSLNAVSVWPMLDMFNLKSSCGFAKLTDFRDFLHGVLQVESGANLWMHFVTTQCAALKATGLLSCL